jgi:hypothetical protein
MRPQEEGSIEGRQPIELLRKIQKASVAVRELCRLGLEQDKEARARGAKVAEPAAFV